MPISAIVLTLDASPCQRQRALFTLKDHPRLTLGELHEAQLPVVVETDTIAEGVDIIREQLPAVDGVTFVHVVSVDFSDLEDFDEKLPPKRRSRAS